uniref:Uncharacterized protein n=1 Tax=Triticum urartu TaxID=4572 RepID=A0A8R7V0R9_TRIUA
MRWGFGWVGGWVVGAHSSILHHTVLTSSPLTTFSLSLTILSLSSLSDCGWLSLLF